LGEGFSCEGPVSRSGFLSGI